MIKMIGIKVFYASKYFVKTVLMWFKRSQSPVSLFYFAILVGEGKAFFTSIYWLTRIDKPAKLHWFSSQLISSRVPEPLPSNYMWSVPTLLGMCYQPEELGSIVSHTNTASVPALLNHWLWPLSHCRYLCLAYDPLNDISFD